MYMHPDTEFIMIVLAGRKGKQIEKLYFGRHAFIQVRGEPRGGHGL